MTARKPKVKLEAWIVTWRSGDAPSLLDERPLLRVGVPIGEDEDAPTSIVRLVPYSPAEAAVVKAAIRWAHHMMDVGGTPEAEHDLLKTIERVERERGRK